MTLEHGYRHTIRIFYIQFLLNQNVKCDYGCRNKFQCAIGMYFVFFFFRFGSSVPERTKRKRKTLAKIGYDILFKFSFSIQYGKINNIVSISFYWIWNKHRIHSFIHFTLWFSSIEGGISIGLDEIDSIVRYGFFILRKLFIRHCWIDNSIEWTKKIEMTIDQF